MKFGILDFYEHPVGGKTEHQVLKERMTTMRSAEDFGYDSVWTPEHHSTEYGLCASPMVTLGALASVTKRIRLASGVIVLPFNDPIRIAEEGATIDLLSDGRFELGVGRGFQPVEYNAFDVDQTKSRDLFEEAIEIIVRAWTEDEFEYHGAHFNIRKQAVRPRPLQKPHPPIWAAAISDASFASAGYAGFNLLCSLVYGFKSNLLAQQIATYREALSVSGHRSDDREISALCLVYCAESTERARQDFGDAVMSYYRRIANYVAPPGAEAGVAGYENYIGTRYAARTVQWDELLRTESVVCGNPELVCQQIEKMRRQYGFTQMLCWTRLAGLENQKVLRSMELFQKKVAPHFRNEGITARPMLFGRPA